MLKDIRTTKIKFYLKCAQYFGLDAELLFQDTNINPVELENPYGTIQYQQYLCIVFNLVRAFPCRSIAFEFAERLTLGDLGILGYTVASSENSKVATELWHKYSYLFFGNVVELRYFYKKDHIIARYCPPENLSTEITRFLIEERLAYDAKLHTLANLGRYPVHKIHLAFPDQGNSDPCRKFPEATIRFDQSENSMYIMNDAYSIPLPGYDPEAHTHCLNLVKKIHESLSENLNFSQKVSKILYASLGASGNVEKIAKTLSTSVRTMHRRLNSEGTTYMKLLNEVRLERAKNYILHTELTSSEISELVGFMNDGSFRKFFKKSTGKTIRDYRNFISGSH